MNAFPWGPGSNSEPTDGVLRETRGFHAGLKPAPRVTAPHAARRVPDRKPTQEPKASWEEGVRASGLRRRQRCLETRAGSHTRGVRRARFGQNSREAVSQREGTAALSDADTARAVGPPAARDGAEARACLGEGAPWAEGPAADRLSSSQTCLLGQWLRPEDLKNAPPLN